MDDKALIRLKSTIEEHHAGDEKQLEVIFSDKERILVEAPAGYGKTTTMISRIAYILAKGDVPNPKKILALTFSVNAALKIKRDTAEKLPALMNVSNNPVSLSEKILATNYHGFCKSVLSKHGFLLDTNLRRNVNSFKAIGDEKIDAVEGVSQLIDTDEAGLCKDVERIVKNGNYPDKNLIEKYLEIIKEKLLPNNAITHNAVLFLAIKLLEEYPEISKFYRNLYKFIIVDEFQDTNIVAWQLIQCLISDSTKLLFLGDPLQRIYGFIGAIPNIMELALDDYNMNKVILTKNYQFNDNAEMLKLDRNIRINASTVMHGEPIEEAAELQGYWGKEQNDEAKSIGEAVGKLINNSSGKVAVLCRSRGDNANAIEKEFADNGIEYFYGMFTDEDEEYVRFHSVCQEKFLNRFGKKQSINSIQLKKFNNEIKQVFESSAKREVLSLLELLDALGEKVTNDYSMLSPEDKYNLLLEIFENRQLKQSMEYIKCNVILATVHGAKGLEWDYVFLPDLEQWVFPGYPTCISCNGKNISTGAKCTFTYSQNVEKQILEELSVFYVGITRARKQVYVSASGKRANDKASRYSCFATMNGVKLVKARL